MSSGNEQPKATLPELLARIKRLNAQRRQIKEKLDDAEIRKDTDTPWYRRAMRGYAAKGQEILRLNVMVAKATREERDRHRQLQMEAAEQNRQRKLARNRELTAAFVDVAREVLADELFQDILGRARAKIAEGPQTDGLQTE